MEYILKTKTRKDFNALISLAKANGIKIEAEREVVKQFRKDMEDFVQDLAAEKRGEKRFLTRQELLDALNDE
jgi:hypothetical protein